MRAIVTGSSRGLGKAISQRLAHEGYQLSLISRDGSMLQSNISQLPNSNLHKVIPFDLINDDLNTLGPEFEGCSVLINCAGMTNYSLLARTDIKEIEDTIRLNLTVPIILSKLAYKPMMKNKSTKIPVIINISSILSLPEYKLPGTSVYSASKSGLDAFTTSLSNEFKGKVRVNSILPGLIRGTDMGAKVKSDIESVDMEKVVEKVIDVITNNSNGETLVVK
ncbi:3-oxoacyl-[acyl-carrier-protein] reductase [[Candida] jaroonii]|uniref:3-oxoacyl-[acyl-carrier-protein] reductase n=1 Tax=[Candida] jaroonii TaxID=467808 RepID=A0ACA9Y0C3_9ASCO|nr:3-oxoacyl-[acyl-carrier-protein] reductase [[Candida] jaroonii]